MPKLTDRFLQHLRLNPGQKDKLVFDSQCRGLGVRLTNTGKRIFLVQWTDPVTKRKVRETLGVWGNLTIDDARKAAQVYGGNVAKGINPKEERRLLQHQASLERAAQALTLDALISKWAKLHLTQKRTRYAQEAQRALRHVFHDNLKVPCSQITAEQITRQMDNLVDAGSASMADHVAAYGHACFNWALKRRMIASNPFHMLPTVSTVKSRDRSLEDDELCDVWSAADRLHYPWKPFFQLAILTIKRREEIAAMRWSELNEDLSLWTIPGSRMKNGKPADVHITEAVRNILNAIPHVEHCDLVLSSNGRTKISGFSKAKLAIDREISARRALIGKLKMNPWRIHDLRRTAVTTLARLGVDSIVADKLLDHQPSKLAGVASVYQRHSFAEEKAVALERWADHVIPRGTIGKVIPFPLAASDGR